MAFAASVAELQEEASCPVCLDYLRDPVTLNCGHNFCDSCIHDQWEDLEDVFPCPVCLHHCPGSSFKRNNQLCHLTDVVKQLPIRRTKCKPQEAELLCETHNEVLDLFCEEDLELLCPQCRVSSDHQGHLLTPTEKAIVDQRKNLKRYVNVLKKKIEDAEVNYTMQLVKALEMKEKVENWRVELEPEFKEIQHFLKKDQISVNTRLRLEEKHVREKFNKHKLQIAKHVSTLKNLLSEITMKSLQTDVDLLRNIKNVHDRYEQLSTPGVWSYKWKNECCTLPPHYFGLQKMIDKFQVNLTLDPNTAHPNLTVSQDRRSAKLGTDQSPVLLNPRKYVAYPAVLSDQSFDSGRHFWQVNIRGPGDWAIGVCTESDFRRYLISPTPKTSFFSFQQSRDTSNTPDAEQEIRVARFGVFLDFELGEYSVYDLDVRACLYKYTGIFTEKLMPYFAIRMSPKPVYISLDTEEEVLL